METKAADHLEKQHQLLLSGQYNSLFNDLTLNLPYRMIAYSQPKVLDPFFNNLYKRIAAAQSEFNGQAVWKFDEIIKIIAPGVYFGNRSAALAFLVNTCQIPEGHIVFDRRESDVPNQILPERQIYLSRYAMMQISMAILKNQDRVNADMSADLMKPYDGKTPDKSRTEFESEVGLIFANYFFSHPDEDCDELVRNTWMWIRGEQLRPQYTAAMEECRATIMRYMKYNVDESKIQAEIEYHKSRFYTDTVSPEVMAHIEKTLKESFTENTMTAFKNKFIFDTLFQKTNGKTFKEEYQDALEYYGYERIYNEKKRCNEWFNGSITAPNNPGAHLAADKTFLVAWVVKKFCEFVKIEHAKQRPRDKNKWFEDITKNFFLTMRQGLISVANSNQTPKFNFINSPKFINQHQYKQAAKIVNAVHNGAGPKKIDKHIGIKISETPGTLEYWKQRTLFRGDEVLCMNVRKNNEARLKILHAEFIKTPNAEIANQIAACEQKIFDENDALYNHNFQGFVDVLVCLNSTGEFVARKILGPAKINTEFSLPLGQPVSLNPRATQLDIFDTGFTPKPGYAITVPNGHSVGRGSFINKKNETIEYFKLDPNGIYQTINPLKKNPTVFRKDGLPKLVIENFELCNFMIESDTMSLGDQIKMAARLVSLNIVNLIVFSGNKSYHMRITVRDVPENADEYKWLYFYILLKLGLTRRQWIPEQAKYKCIDSLVDLSICTPNRSMRRPDATRMIDGGRPVKQELIHQSNDIWDINWRNEYEKEMNQIRIQQEYNRLAAPQFYDKPNQNIDKFMDNYSRKNHISLTFDRGNGHANGIVLIGAATKAGFNSADIDKWMQENCDRYSELIPSWRSLLNQKSI